MDNKKLLYLGYIVFWTIVVFLLSWWISKDIQLAFVITGVFFLVILFDMIRSTNKIQDAYRRRTHSNVPGHVRYHSYRWWGR